MNGPCMCGDICCSSCGPAQGNSRCPICRAWASEGCEHYDEETGELKEEFVPQFMAAMEAERLADITYAEQLKEEYRQATEYWEREGR